MTDAFNMSMRKFLKQVGVTSQQAIEEGLRARGAVARNQNAGVVCHPDIMDDWNGHPISLPRSGGVGEGGAAAHASKLCVCVCVCRRRAAHARAQECPSE